MIYNGRNYWWALVVHDCMIQQFTWWTVRAFHPHLQCNIVTIKFSFSANLIEFVLYFTCACSFTSLLLIYSKMYILYIFVYYSAFRVAWDCEIFFWGRDVHHFHFGNSTPLPSPSLWVRLRYSNVMFNGNPVKPQNKFIKIEIWVSFIESLYSSKNNMSYDSFRSFWCAGGWPDDRTMLVEDHLPLIDT